VTSEGLHSCVSWKLKFGKLLFEYSLNRRIEKREGETIYADPPLLIEVPKDIRGIDLEIFVPDQVRLDCPNLLCFEIRSGHTPLLTLELAINSPPTFQFIIDSAKYENKEETVSIADNMLIFKDIDVNEKIRFCVPYKGQASQMVRNFMYL